MKTLVVFSVLLCCGSGCSNVTDLERRVASLEKRTTEQAETIETLQSENATMLVRQTATGNLAKQNEKQIEYLKEDKADKR